MAHLSGTDYRVHEHARGAEQACEQIEKLALQRQALLHDGFGVQAPTFRIGSVEGQLCPRQ